MFVESERKEWKEEPCARYPLWENIPIEPTPAWPHLLKALQPVRELQASGPWAFMTEWRCCNGETQNAIGKRVEPLAQT